MENKKWRIAAGVAIAMAVIIFLRDGLSRTNQKLEIISEDEVRRACSRWSFDRNLLIEHEVIKEENGDLTIKYHDLNDTHWVFVAFDRKGGLETFTNLDPAIEQEKVSSKEPR